MKNKSSFQNVLEKLLEIDLKFVSRPCLKFSSEFFVQSKVFIWLRCFNIKALFNLLYITELKDHKDLIQSFCWKVDGSLLVTSSKVHDFLLCCKKSFLKLYDTSSRS